MIRMASIWGWLFLIVAAATFAQSSSTTAEAELCTAEDYVISAVALNDLIAKHKPDRVLLRDYTFERSPRIAMDSTLPPEVSDEVKAYFAFRNATNAKIDGGKIKAPIEIILLSAEEEGRLIESGGGCDRKAPVVFVSRPGVNAGHNRALISVGTSCYGVEEDSVLLLLGKDGGDWKVMSSLVTSSTTIDYFPTQSQLAFARVEPKIVNFQQTDAGDQYLLKISFLVPDVPNDTFDTITVYGARIVGTQRSDDRDYLSLHGSWKPNQPAEFSVRVPKEFTDPSKGWILTFCVGSTAGCYPSSNLLTLISQKKDR